MPTCIVCHQPIRPGEEGQESEECPNGHALHRDPCLKQWFATGKHPTCPFCREPYAAPIQEFFQQLLSDLEASGESSVEVVPELDEQAAASINALKEREELIDRVTSLIEQGKLDAAANVLFDFQDNKSPNDPEIAYLLGMVFFLQQKYGLAVNHLMKAVKIEFKMPMAFYYLAKCFLELDMPEKAVWAAERAIVHFGPEESEARTFCKNLVASKLPGSEDA